MGIVLRAGVPIPMLRIPVLIKNTKDSTWISDWVLDAFHGLHADEYDIHLYAKWEKEVVSNNEQKTQENVSEGRKNERRSKNTSNRSGTG